MYNTDSVNFEGSDEDKAKVKVENSTATEGFVADENGHVTGLKVVTSLQEENGPFTRQPGTERVIPADLVLISVGFLHPDTETILDQLPVELDKRGNIARNDKFATSQDGVFVCGDAGRGQSLVVWAIAEGAPAPQPWTSTSPRKRASCGPDQGQPASDDAASLKTRCLDESCGNIYREDSFLRIKE